MTVGRKMNVIEAGFYSFFLLLKKIKILSSHWAFCANCKSARIIMDLLSVSEQWIFFGMYIMKLLCALIEI